MLISLKQSVKHTGTPNQHTTLIFNGHLFIYFASLPCICLITSLSNFENPEFYLIVPLFAKLALIMFDEFLYETRRKTCIIFTNSWKYFSYLDFF